MKEILRGWMDDDPTYLRRISKELVREAILKDSRKYAELAVISYSLSKILSKIHFRTSRNWKTYRKKIRQLLLEGADTQRIVDEIYRMDEKDGLFVKNVVEKARTKMAGRAYAMGLSLSTAADLFEADKKDLSNYVGQTKVHDSRWRIGIEERLAALRRLQR